MTDIASQSTQPRRRGSPARPIVEFPEATSVDWIDPPAFHDALRLHLARHGDTYWHLHRSIIRPGERFDRKTLQSWGGGTKVPHTAVSMRMLERIEDRYRLPRGYFADKLPKAGRAIRQSVPGVSAAERRRLAWHLPDDFEERPREEQEEILDWMRTTIITESTDYRRYQSEATRIRFSLQFPDLRLVQLGCTTFSERRTRRAPAPPALTGEIAQLIRFKTSTLTAIGERRSGVWGDEIAEQKLEHLGLLFGALTADPEGPAGGCGASSESLTLALLAFPQVWD